MPKRVVHYKKSIGPIVVGASATVWPIDHYNPDRVSNTTWVWTSNVVEVVNDEEFHTLNSIYRKVKEQ